MGSTGGGIWKTTDAGHSWTNISDGQLPVGSMGAIEVSPSDPNIIFAGTGSSKIRSNVSIGRGMFKSVDAGKTWTFSGLRDVGQISTIRVHPTNPAIVFVAALGNPFVPNVDRGVFRSSDGGATWKKILFVSDSSGAADLELQPGNPNVVFASMWHGQRKPWTIVSGAKEGGIYKSTDGGDTWTKLGGGLPTGLFGRSNVSIPAVSPNRIYALIEAKPGGGLYRSDDAGATWTLVNGAQNLWTRPFYYTTLEADPNNADVVFVGNEGWFKSIDGGKTFRSAGAARRQPRHVDQSEELGLHDPVERRRRERLARRRPQLEHAGQPAHGRDLPGGARQPVSVSRVRRAAGQHHAHRAVAAARRGPGRGVAHRPRLRDGPDHSEPHEPRHRLRLVQGTVQPHERQVPATKGSTGWAANRSTATAAPR